MTLADNAGVKIIGSTRNYRLERRGLIVGRWVEKAGQRLIVNLVVIAMSAPRAYVPRAPRLMMTRFVASARWARE